MRDNHNSKITSAKVDLVYLRSHHKASESKPVLIKNDLEEQRLNESRFRHSSCVMGNQVYVFCGSDGHHELTSIEFVHMDSMLTW